MPGNSVICSSSEKLVGLHTTQANTNLGECGTWGRHGEIWDMGEMLAKLNNNSYKVYVQNEKKRNNRFTGVRCAIFFRGNAYWVWLKGTSSVKPQTCASSWQLFRLFLSNKFGIALPKRIWVVKLEIVYLGLRSLHSLLPTSNGLRLSYIWPMPVRWRSWIGSHGGKLKKMTPETYDTASCCKCHVISYGIM